MSLNSHLTELRRKHEALAAQVEAESRKPASDTLELTALKKRKLAIKEQITRLSDAHMV